MAPDARTLLNIVSNCQAELRICAYELGGRIHCSLRAVRPPSKDWNWAPDRIAGAVFVYLHPRKGIGANSRTPPDNLGEDGNSHV